MHLQKLFFICTRFLTASRRKRFLFISTNSSSKVLGWLVSEKFIVLWFYSVILVMILQSIQKVSKARSIKNRYFKFNASGSACLFKLRMITEICFSSCSATKMYFLKIWFTAISIVFIFNASLFCCLLQISMLCIHCVKATITRLHLK